MNHPLKGRRWQETRRKMCKKHTPLKHARRSHIHREKKIRAPHQDIAVPPGKGDEGQ